MASIKQSKPSQQFEWTRYLHACSCSNCGFYYIPNFLLLPLPSAWFITGKEQYRWCFFLFIILGPPDSYFLQMHDCFAGSGCQLAFLVLVCHGIINLIYFTSFFPHDHAPLPTVMKRRTSRVICLRALALPVPNLPLILSFRFIDSTKFTRFTCS